jgi:hypothetical protein
MIPPSIKMPDAIILPVFKPTIFFFQSHTSGGASHAMALSICKKRDIKTTRQEKYF